MLSRRFESTSVPYLLLVSKLFSMAGHPDNIPLRAKGYLESGIGLITNLTLSRTLTLRQGWMGGWREGGNGSEER